MNWIDTKDQAAYLRKFLKSQYPETKFSVRIERFAGGSAVNVNWTDGPASEEIDAILRGYQGGGFDGMIDMAYSIDSYLNPQTGEARFASTDGTAGSRGSVPKAHTWKPGPEWERVDFSAKFVHGNRKVTQQQEVIDKVIAAFGGDVDRYHAERIAWRIVSNNSGEQIAAYVAGEISVDLNSGKVVAA